uniref:Uncharacterized protein n=1 Tax=Plectus sambesii TaxID=2011161 RepID=A0A914UZE6_9BILA
MSPKLYTECFVQPALQYFLATLCDYQVDPEQRSRLGLRYSNTPEVRRLLGRLQKAKFVSPGAHGACPNAIVSALKEILTSFPGGIFNDISEEFYCISLNSALDITIVYLHGLLEALPYFLRQFTYLICRSLRNLVFQSSGSLVDSYTDLLLLFTPALFPTSVGDVQRFLRASRLTLVMVDRCEQVFQPVVLLDKNGNVCQPVSEDEAFFHQVFESLSRLEASLDSDSEVEDEAP